MLISKVVLVFLVYVPLPLLYRVLVGGKNPAQIRLVVEEGATLGTLLSAILFLTFGSQVSMLLLGLIFVGLKDVAEPL